MLLQYSVLLERILTQRECFKRKVLKISERILLEGFVFRKDNRLKIFWWWETLFALR